VPLSHTAFREEARVSATRPDKVAVFLAGVQKGGTTSLFAHLRLHPQLAAGETKELHYFDDEREDWRSPDYARFEARFAPDAGDRLRFDATPIYLFWPPALERIRRYNPSARFIVIFREPIERAYSAWCMEFGRGVEPLTFADAIRHGRGRLPADPPTAPDWRVYSYVERGFYGAQIARALSLFPREQFLFLRTSRLDQDHAAVLQSIAGFLSIAPFAPGKPIRARQRSASRVWPELSPDDRRHLQALYHEDTCLFASLSGLNVDDWPSRHAPVASCPAGGSR
jgi:hypothetical protein